ncbi:uncharacterized protein LOC110023302 [Phalaenopsis equestris]|uniref:uncharacterized protein LOC110023302 n=1 Tax=Phalaenopsis equestris TaxID=78828 RepID=UPI0009E54EB5|nr:uncharacterized protein LOC110023302 [Phalaenopsis equestris]
MQPCCLVCRASTDGGGALGVGLVFLSIPARKPLYFSWIGFGLRYCDRLSRGAGPVVAAVAESSGGADQDHYSVLGIRRNATMAEIKHAYRLLAREHHPDVSRDQQAGEVFKKIHLAYEVLSDEVKRARYNLTYRFPAVPNQSRRKIYNWEELRQQMHAKRQKNKDDSWTYQAQKNQDTTSYEREPFVEVLRFAFFALFFMQTIGCRASLTLCGISAFLDRQLDAGYKMGYVMAWFLGGRTGCCSYLALHVHEAAA